MLFRSDRFALLEKELDRRPVQASPVTMKVDPVAILKDDGRDHGNAVKVQVVGTDNTFTLSPIPASKPIPELPTNMMPTDVAEHYGAACGNALKRLCHRIDPHGPNLPTRYPAKKPVIRP